MFKKAIKPLAIILGASFLAMCICIPLSISSTINQVQQITQNANISAKRIDIDSSVTTLQLDQFYYHGNFVLKQSPDDTAYVELYERPAFESATVSVSYPDQDTASVYADYRYGNFVFDKAAIEKTIAMSFQHYPTAILYIPKRMNLKLQYPHNIPDHIQYANREELIKQFDEDETRRQEEDFARREQELRDLENQLREMSDRLYNDQSEQFWSQIDDLQRQINDRSQEFQPQMENLQRQIYDLQNDISNLNR